MSNTQTHPLNAGSAGPIALAGSGEYTDAMNEADRALLAALAAKQPHVVVIPTASGLEPGMPAVWNARGVAHFSKLNAKVTPLHITEREHCYDDANVKALREADFFYFSGGNPNYVVETWHDTPAWATLVSRWQNGAALAGCSAGAMMLGSFTIRVRDAMTGNTPMWVPAMGLVHGIAVLPHFDRMRGFVGNDAFRGIIKTAPAHVSVVGIDEDTALVRLRNAWQVMGRQTVTLFDREGNPQRFAGGARVPLQA
jgi:cyanophycinase